MPAKAPPVGDLLAAKLQALGQSLRVIRRAHKVTATATAEAAGVSRVTLHRIERGVPSVAMGAYLSVIDALALELDVVDPGAHPAGTPRAGVPERIRLDEYPQLKRLAWQRRGAAVLSPQEALNLYERNWRHVDEGSLQPSERALVQALVAAHGGRRLLV